MNARRWAVCVSLAAILVAVGIWRPWLSSPAEAPGGAATQPQRIASLTLGTDEILAEIVPIKRILCVTHLADDPEISNVAGYYPKQVARLKETSPERILALSPDLVCVAPYNSADFLKVMERSGLNVYRNEACQTMDEIEEGIIELGRQVGEPARANELAEQMRERRRRLADRLGSIARRPRVLFWSAGFTSGDKTTINDIIREGGAQNVAIEKGLHGVAEIAPEQVIAADPDFILLSRWSADERAGRIENHPLLRNLRAVREKRVLTIAGKYLTSVSHHVVQGAEQLAHMLHADLFPANQSSQTSR